MNLPLSFIQQTKSLLNEQWESFETALGETSPVSVRLHPIKSRDKKILIENVQSVLWSEYGFYLPARPSFTFDPLFHAGVYYVQEASSMFLEQVFRQYVPDSVRVLDLCAAPGGKSTHIASLIDADSLLVSNEVIASRANILLDNIVKSGYENIVVTNNDPAAFGRLSGLFDVLVVDAPCSGEGMFRKDADAISEWSEANVQLCQERQQRIVSDAWSSLKEDGLLIYSTCTYNLHEDEENIRWIAENLGAEVLSLQIEDTWKITPSLLPDFDKSVYRFLPHKTKGEGFFLAVLRKTSSLEEKTYLKKKDKKQTTKPQPLPKGVKDLILNAPDFCFQEINGKWRAYSPPVADFLAQIDGLKILNAGIFLGEQKGKDFVVSHALALSNKLNRNAFSSVDLDKETAINYLRKEPFLLPDAPKGYVLLTFENSPIGFAKNIGNRVNNNLPNEWRIRSKNLPENDFVWME